MTDSEKERQRIEKRRAANRASYLRNRETRLEKNRQWRRDNPERMKALNEKWYREHHDIALAARKVYREANRDRMRELLKAWYQANRERILAEHRLETTGCTPEQYESMLADQGGVCAICKKAPEGKSLAADHDHRTGEIRGLLCFGCNTILGLADDNVELLERAISYLRR